MVFKTFEDLRQQIGQRKPLAYFNSLKMDDYISAVWHYYGIMVHDNCDYNGFVRRNSKFDIYIPIPNEIGRVESYKDEDCEHRLVRTFPDVKQTINRMYRAD